MTAIGITRNQRFVSRVLFYLGALATMWGIGVITQPVDGWLSDEALGAAKVYIASPIVPDSESSKSAH